MNHNQKLFSDTLRYSAPECKTVAVDLHGILCGSLTEPSSTITDMTEEKLDNGFWR